MNIRTKIIVALLSVSLSGIALIGYYAFYFSEKQLINAQKEKLTVLASRQKKDIYNMLNDWEEIVALISSHTQLRRVLNGHLEQSGSLDKETISKIFNDAMQAVTEIQQIHLCDPRSNHILSVGKPVLGKEPCSAYASKRNESIKLQDIWRNTGDTTIYVLFSGPLVLDDKFIGVIEVIARGERLLSIVENPFGMGNTGETLIAARNENGDARFITPLKFQENPNLSFGVAANEFKIPITQALLKREVFLSRKHNIDYRGVPTIAMTAYIPEMDWGLVVKIDRDEALKPITLLLNNLIVGAGILFAAVIILGVFLGNTISRPIMMLALAAEKTKEGDLSHRANINTRDEIGYLAKVFDDMLVALANKTQALAQSEQRLRSTFNTVIDGIVTIDKNGTVHTVNPAVERLFGYSEEELIGKNVNMLMPEPYRTEHDGYLRRYHRTKEKRIIGIGREVEGKRKDGSVFPIELGVSEICLQDETLFVGTLRDITERKITEHHLTTLEARHDLALRGLSVGIWDWNVQTNNLFWSNRFKEIVGITEQGFVPHFNEFSDRLHEEDKAETLAAVDNHLKHKIPYDVEYRLKHNAGHYVWIHAQGQAVWEDDIPTRMVGSVDDISEKKHAQIALEESRAFLSLMMDKQPDLVFVKDESFKILQANQAFLNVYPEEIRNKIIGSTTVEKYDKKEADEFLAMDKKAFSEGNSEITEKINFPDGRIRTLYTQKIRFYNQQGDPFILCIGRDITERERLIEKLTESNEELEEFAYRTSHDLRSPLVSSIRLIDIAVSSIESNKVSHALNSLSHVQTSLKKLEILVQDILALTQAKNEDEETDLINIEEIVNTALNKFSHLENYNRVDFIKEIKLNEPLKSKRSRLVLIVENLISNAIKYQDTNKQQSFIRISALKDDNFFVFKVHDNGLGIPENQHEKLFTMFKRFHTKVSFGSGLGLYMMKKSADILNGQISFEDPGCGAIFKLKIPIPE